MPNNNLILRSVVSPWITPTPDFTRNSVLSFSDVDNNFIYLKGELINSIETSGNTITLKKINGNDLSFNVGSGGGSDYWTSGSTGFYSIKTINDSGLDATGNYSVAEGFNTTASGNSSHAEGFNTISAGSSSHAGGNSSTASGSISFIHSYNSLVTGDRSAVLGGQNITGTTDDTVYVPNLEVRGQAYTPIYDNLTGGTTFIPDWDNSNVQILTLSGNTNVSGGTSTMEGGSAYTVIVKQSNGGSHTITWDSTYKWEAGSPPTLSVADGSVDIITFICDGTSLYGLIAKDFQ